MRGAHVSLLGGLESRFPSGARGVDVEDRRGPAFLLPAARHLAGRCGEYDRQWLLQASVSRAADGVCRGGPEAPGGEPGGECRITRVRTVAAFAKQASDFLWVRKFTLITTRRLGSCPKSSRRCDRISRSFMATPRAFIASGVRWRKPSVRRESTSRH